MYVCSITTTRRRKREGTPHHKAQEQVLLSWGSSTQKLGFNGMASFSAAAGQKETWRILALHLRPAETRRVSRPSFLLCLGFGFCVGFGLSFVVMRRLKLSRPPPPPHAGSRPCPRLLSVASAPGRPPLLIFAEARREKASHHNIRDANVTHRTHTGQSQARSCPSQLPSYLGPSSSSPPPPSP